MHKEKIFIFFSLKKKTRWPKSWGGPRQSTFLYTLVTAYNPSMKVSVVRKATSNQSTSKKDQSMSRKKRQESHFVPTNKHLKNRPEMRRKTCILWDNQLRYWTSNLGNRLVLFLPNSVRPLPQKILSPRAAYRYQEGANSNSPPCP